MQFGGIPLEAVVRATAVDRFAVCTYIEEEIVRILTRKFAWELNRIVADLSFYWADAIHVELQGTITGPCRDPNDEAILECAIRAGAAYLVTGDDDLLTIAHTETSALSVPVSISRTRRDQRVDRHQQRYDIHATP